MELAGILDVLLHFGRQHFQVGEDVVADDCCQGYRGQQDDERPAKDDPL